MNAPSWGESGRCLFTRTKYQHSSWNKHSPLNLALLPFSEVFMFLSKSIFLICDDASQRIPPASPLPFHLHQLPVFDSLPSLTVPALGSPPISCESGYFSHSTTPSSPSEEGWGLCQEKLASSCHPTIPASSFCQPA